ncbi:hypothetical protein BGX38DRAFT_1265584 [Terfezia claveryi]|nr:hypothetical protein BGX38DRAFT_1265584 [Terfezia claveryi]
MGEILLGDNRVQEEKITKIGEVIRGRIFEIEEGDGAELSLGGRCRQGVLEPPVVGLKLDEKSPKQESTVWDGEIAGVRGALEVARQEEKILFMTDSKAAIMAIVNTCKSQDTRTEDLK